MPLAPIEDIINDARAGKMFILVDDEDRENEGDLVIPAQFADDKVINFMATHGRGLICLSLTGQRADQLGLRLMPKHNQSRLETAFTISIEAREGVTTGISAADRATTIAAAIDPTKGADAIATPGHVFPLIARDGGTLVRAGHTEAAVDIATLAGVNPSGVICEILKEDGTMARMPDLIPFAEKHGLKIAKIADLIEYRRKKEQLVVRELDTLFHSHWGGEFQLHVYRNTQDDTEHLALVKGKIDAAEPTLVRVHALNVLSDVLADADVPHHKQCSMELINEAGKGIILLLQPGPTSLSEQLRQRMTRSKPESALRDYGIGAQILRDLGVGKMILLTSSPKPIIGLEGYGLEVTEYRKPE